MRDAVDLALAQNARVPAGEQRIRVAEGLRVQAGLKPNPRLFFQHENARAWERPGPVYLKDTDTFLYTSQTIEAGGKRERRVEFATAGVAQAEADVKVIRRQLSTRVAGAYWSALGAERVRQLLEEEEQNLVETVRYVESRVKEGAAAGTDLMRIRLEQQRVSAQHSLARQEAARARARLFEEIGVPVRENAVLAEDLRAVRSVAVPEMDTILDQRPEIQAVRRAVAHAEANAKLQRANARPDPEVLAGYKRTGGFDTLLVGVQINLPVRNKNQGLIAAADAEIRVAREALRGITVQVAAEVNAARTDYLLKSELVAQALPVMLENARESARVINLAWKEGGVDILRLLDADRVRIEVELQYARALAEYQQSALQLMVAVGVNP